MAITVKFTSGQGPFLGPFTMDIWSILFILIWLIRYVRFIVNAISSWTYRPIPIALEVLDKFPSGLVTVIVPTIAADAKDEAALVACLTSIARNKPGKIILVTIRSLRERITELAAHVPAYIEVLDIEYPNKRHQVACGLPSVKTPFVYLADDDVLWPLTFLQYTLPIFADSRVGALGTSQRVRYLPGLSLMGRVWQYLGACYIERRNFEISATSHIDGGMSCLSGRTGAFRSDILKNPAFLHTYLNETYCGRPLNPDDDNCITRWLVNRKWKIVIQMAYEAQLETFLETNDKFLKQCLRWARSNWRSNFTSMFLDRVIWRDQPWCAYALHLATFSHSIVHDPLLIWLLYKVTGSFNNEYMHMFFGWLAFVKTFKLIPHFMRHPLDVFLLPVTFIFGYLHGIIKYYALFTVNNTTWGSRPETAVNPADVPIESIESEAEGIIAESDASDVDSVFSSGLSFSTRESTPGCLWDGSVIDRCPPGSKNRQLSGLDSEPEWLGTRRKMNRRNCKDRF